MNSVEVEWVGQMTILGTYKHKRSFPHNYLQEKYSVKQMFGNNF